MVPVRFTEGIKLLHLRRDTYTFWWLSVKMWQKSFLWRVSLDRNSLCSLCGMSYKEFWRKLVSLLTSIILFAVCYCYKAVKSLALLGKFYQITRKCKVRSGIAKTAEVAWYPTHNELQRTVNISELPTYIHSTSECTSTAMENNTLIQHQHHVWSGNLKFSHLQIHTSFLDMPFRAWVHQQDTMTWELIS